ncbi:hypothetical protein K503DRAFT_867288 [Rhizopogon vinicolor AM-OR11-026]|uniref:WW domain-containing protein n=1 Tax=Rhizopogon vinicolor AM-OR11-026 TaxID=1314800 RepID=A0A1B7MW32_9AGAM|nr:hypothetical protein K503DRAFT_867288 [Rhizopogon vinicolor AM-OR11-026]
MIPRPHWQTQTFMTSRPLKEYLLKMLVAFTKRIKFVKLSVRDLRFAFRPLLELFRRLLHGISHKLSCFPAEPRLIVDSGIMGATQPTQNVIPVTQPDHRTSSNEEAIGKTLAVRPLENFAANTTSSQHGIGGLIFPTMPMPMDQFGTTGIPESSAAPCLNITGRGQIPLRAIVASEFRRYNRVFIQDKVFRVFTVDPGLHDFTDPSSHDPNWLRLTHPEGARYFYNPHQRLFTDENVWENDIASEILTVAMEAKQRATDSGITLSETMELTIEKFEDGKFGYYFVDHDAQILFWPELVRSWALMNGIRGVTEKSHIRYALEAQYWRHCTLFPNMRILPGPIVERLRDMIAYAHAESITSETSLSPFDLSELSNMLGLIDQVTASMNKENEHAVCIVARYMNIFIQAKFVNFCGQRGARLDADQSLYDSENEDIPAILRILNVVLFNSPNLHRESLNKVWVDKTVVKPRWNKFMDQLNSEWNSFTVFSTVMLAADVSFLAVPGVDDPTTAIKSPTTIVIYMSTLCAMGSLVISLVLAGQVNNNRRSSPGNVAKFMTAMSKSLLGVESVALMHSLPFALLIWGMIFFAIGLSILIFSDTADVAALIGLAPIWAIVVLLTTWPVLAANNLHISAVAKTAAKAAAKSWNEVMHRIVCQCHTGG